MEIISGFSKLTKQEKINWLASQLKANDSDLAINSIDRFWHDNIQEQKIFDDFSENTISNFYFPYGIAPNFSINNKVYAIPMVIEESSVVAAASKAAKFWLTRGGFKTQVLSTTKAGQVHFLYSGDKETIQNFFQLNKVKLLQSVKAITANMDKRGGGVKDLVLLDKTSALENYYQLHITFETCDAMGANFINSVLEHIANKFTSLAQDSSLLSLVDQKNSLEVIMSILTNYTPECIVRAYVECPISDLGVFDGNMAPLDFAKRFERAVQIAKVDINRAVTHNKGIFNGIDSVVLATGNDFRAIEACGHAYAAKDGQYRGLSSCLISNDTFRLELTIPLPLGTVGGLTNLHPMAKTSLDILGRPNASELMEIVAVVGLAQNFGALTSLVTSGIQKGHMKMHLLNILNQLGATKQQIEITKNYFADKTVSFQAVRNFLEKNSIH